MFGQSLLSGAFGSSILDPGLNFNNKLYDGANVVQSIGGKIKGAANFNGSSSTLVTGWTHSSLTFSASCWVKFGTQSFGSETIITTTDDSMGAANDGFTIAANKCWLNQNDAFPYTAEITYSATVNDDVWHNIVVTNDGTTFKVYIDGSLDGSVSSTGWTDYGTNPLAMGYQPRNPVNQWYNGQIDQVRIFSTALTTAQITSLHTETAATASTLDFPSGAGCVVAYTFDTNSNNIIDVTTDVATCNFPTGAGCEALYQFEDNATDTCGNYNGTTNNVTYTSGLFSKAALFNGTSTDIDISSSAINVGNPYTLSMWLNFTDVTNGDQGIFANITSSRLTNEIAVVFHLGLFYIYSVVSNGNTNLDAITVTPPSTIANNTWYNVIITADRSLTNKAKVFINGSECSYSVNSGAASTQAYSNIKIGLADGTNRFFEGKLDQLRFFNTALTAAQVTELARGAQYNGASTNVAYNGFLNFQPDLVWQKSYSTNGANHLLTDSVRGTPQAVFSNDASGQQTWGMGSLDANGFTTQTNTAMNGDGNVSGQNYITWNWKAGSDTYAGVFNGSSSYITTSYNQNDTAAFSWSCWMSITNVATAPNDNILGSMESGSPFNGVALFLDVDDIALSTNGNNIGNIVTNASTNTWYHIVVTYDGSGTFKTYAGGSIVSTISQTPVDGGNFWFGDGGPSSWNSFDGLLDGVRLYNTELTGAQVLELYNETASSNNTLNFPSGAGCVAAYTLNKTANDVSGNYNGTASNVTYVKSGYTGRNNDGTVESQVSANQDAGFSIVKFTANSTTPTVGHGLTNSIPDLIIVKATSFSDSWFVNSSFLTNRTDKALRFNQNSAEETNSGFWNNIAPTSTTFSLGNGIAVSGSSYIAYCWHSVDKYSKIGTYVGNNSSNPIDVGFEPAWVMAKGTDSSSWLIMDSTRGANDQLYPNLSAAEYTDSGNSFSATGFTMKSNGNWNASGVTYIYMAFAVPLT